MTKTYKIHPALGIARMGNLPLDVNNSHSFFNGSESPYEIPNNGMDFKVGGRLKKQAQRFWIYEYEDGVATRVINMGMDDVADIAWHVELGNRKAALDTSSKHSDPPAPPAKPPSTPT